MAHVKNKQELERCLPLNLPCQRSGLNDSLLFALEGSSFSALIDTYIFFVTYTPTHTERQLGSRPRDSRAGSGPLRPDTTPCRRPAQAAETVKAETPFPSPPPPSPGHGRGPAAAEAVKPEFKRQAAVCGGKGGGEPVRRAASPHYAALPFTPTVLPGAATGPVLTEPVGAGAGKHGDGPAEAGAAGGTPRGRADPPPPPGTAAGRGRRG